MKFNLPLFSLLVLVALSCNKSEDGQPVSIPEGERVLLVGNEGGFNAGNASLTLFNFSNNQLSQEVYSNANQGEPIGDVLQSINFENDELYLIVNNSEKIEVVGAQNFEKRRTISIVGGSPRYMSFVSEQKAFVSDLYAGGLHVINPENGAYIDFLDLPNSVEHMLNVGDEVWAAESIDQDFVPGDELIIIQGNTNQLVGNISLSAGVNTIFQDKNDMVWALCLGDGFANPVVASKLYKIDPQTKEVVLSLELPELVGYSPVAMAISPNKDFVYYIQSGSVFRMNVDNTSLPSDPFIENNFTFLYTIHCDQESGQIALTDAKDFAQNGDLHLFDKDGIQSEFLSTQINPNSVVWY